MALRFLLRLCVLIAVLALVTAAETRRERQQFVHAIRAPVWGSRSHYPGTEGQRRGGYGINAYGAHENHDGGHQKYAGDHQLPSRGGGFRRGGYGIKTNEERSSGKGGFGRGAPYYG